MLYIIDELILRKILLLVCVYTSFTSKGLRQLRKKKVEDERKWKDEKQGRCSQPTFWFDGKQYIWFLIFIRVTNLEIHKRRINVHFYYIKAVIILILNCSKNDVLWNLSYSTKEIELSVRRSMLGYISNQGIIASWILWRD